MSTRADDLATLLGILADAPIGGFTLFEIQDRSPKWPLRVVNELMVALGSQVQHEKTRNKATRIKETRYWLRNRS